MLSCLFLSTPSARRATPGFSEAALPCWYFYPRPPRGGRPLVYYNLTSAWIISIHALREEGDLSMLQPAALTRIFLSTPSARRATTQCDYNIYFHNDFYPRPPRGGRPIKMGSVPSLQHFYPRPPRGGRQAGRENGKGYHRISIHALREEGDLMLETPSFMMPNFYPRPPRGGRLTASTAMETTALFLSTPSARRATNQSMSDYFSSNNFYPRPPRGGRHPVGL